MNENEVEQEIIETELSTKQMNNALKSKKIVVKGKKLDQKRNQFQNQLK